MTKYIDVKLKNVCTFDDLVRSWSYPEWYLSWSNCLITEKEEVYRIVQKDDEVVKAYLIENEEDRENIIHQYYHELRKAEYANECYDNMFGWYGD